MKTKNLPIILIFFQAAILVYFFNQSINKIGVNEHGFIGFTTEAFNQKCAENLAKYNTYSDNNYPNIQPTNFRPPLFPFLLAVIYKIFSVNEIYGLILNNVLLLITTIVIYKTGEIFNKKIGFFSALLFMAEPYLIERANSIQTEISHIFFLSLSLYFAVRIFYKNEISSKNIFLFSSLFFLSTFTRTVTLYYPIVFVIIMIFIYKIQNRLSLINKFQLKKIIMIFLTINLVGTMSWSIRNYIYTGNYGFSGMTGVHFGLFVAPGVYSQANSIKYSEARNLIRKKYFNSENFHSMNSSEQQDYLTSIGKKIILENPIGFIKWYCIQAKQLFLGYPVSIMLLFYPKDKIQKAESIMRDSPSDDIKSKLLILKNLYDEGFIFYIIHMVFYKIFYLILLIASVIGSIFMISDSSNNRLIGLVIASVFYYLIGIYLFSAPARLRISLLPMMVLFSSYFFIHIKSYFYRKIKN
tara:strand:- start:796 stop:2199 length:1404 start_codon:yes stop_codon:yes gene_type:complete